MSTRATPPDFFELAQAIAREVPPGRVTTYGAIARAIGTGRCARMVGWAMAQSHGVVPEVPAHRVVNRLGMLSGKHHFDTPERMQQLLEAEGVEVRDDCVQNFAERFWNPSHELGFG